MKRLFCASLACFLALPLPGCSSDSSDPAEEAGSGGTAGASGQAGQGGSAAGQGGKSGAAGKGAGAGGTNTGGSGAGGANAGGANAGGTGGGAQAGSGQAGSAQAGSGQAGSAGAGQAGKGQAGQGQAGSGQAGQGQAGQGQAGQGQAGSGQAGSGQAGSGQAGQGQAGQGQAGQGQAGSGGDEPIGQWTDSPGACPAGMTQVDLHTASELASASRGEDAYAGDAPDTCYFLHDGVYDQTGVVMYVTTGGVAGGARRVFVGESRAGVVIHGRANIEDGVGDVTIANLTIDLTGYSQDGSFNTINLGTGKNITLDHLTLTGDCATGHKGGHIETNGTDGVLIEACLIEKFGSCASGGHEDHGIYLASGKNIVIRNNEIRQNSSRGIQFYTAGGDYGTLDAVTIERNHIHGNGHGDYEDGIVINGTDTGTISHVTIQRNILDHNYFSAIRFVGDAVSEITVSQNTLDSNSAGSSLDGRSEINLDDVGSGAGTTISGNLVNVGFALLNSCYDATGRGFVLGNNFVNGAIPMGTKADCIQMQTTGDPQFASASGGDYHPQNPAAASFGAYAP
jgi:hypothetical protein